ncbi:uncharacterized protein LOC123306839 [Coccinella septempunctata]|uniref:uncharacterized protein LOC123306839 n=1 Tax=Coccinella septempunctata TaxID=41139 RepID=UPI001D0614AF|nr:uncharacterized protein LOC123306839 [Coccinella septempunctata]
MKLSVLKIFVILSVLATCSCIGFIRDLIQFNVAGIPEIHKTSTFPFDPDEGIRRSKQYQEVNGRFGEKAIERLGLGSDGKEQERLEEQRIRDQGQLGGVREYLP